MDWKLATHVSHPELLLSADGPHVSSHEDTEKETETPASSDRTPLESHHHSSDLLQTCTSIISAFRKQAEHVKCVEAVIHDGLAEMTRRGVQGEEVKGEEVSTHPTSRVCRRVTTGKANVRIPFVIQNCRTLDVGGASGRCAAQRRGHPERGNRRKLDIILQRQIRLTSRTRSSQAKGLYSDRHGDSQRYFCRQQ
jgi:hypothetical protein